MTRCWENLVEISCVGTSSIDANRILLKLDLISFIYVSVVLLIMKSSTSDETWFFRRLVLTLFHMKIWRLGGLAFLARQFMSNRIVVSWSLIPILGVHLFTKLGRCVATISEVFVPLVGKLTVCLRLHDRNVSKKQSLMSLRLILYYWVCLPIDFGQVHVSPNHIGLFLYFMFNFVSSLLILLASSRELLGGLYEVAIITGCLYFYCERFTCFGFLQR